MWSVEECNVEMNLGNVITDLDRENMISMTTWVISNDLVLVAACQA